MTRLRSLLVASALGTAAVAQAQPSAVDLAEGLALFTQGAAPACAVCHTLKAAGSTGDVGPVLDELKPSADRVAAALRNGVGLMPAYKGQLTEAQILVLARYVAAVSGR